MPRNKFSRGRSTFICDCCGHRTRLVDQPGDSNLCPECDELAMQQNAVFDHCADAGTIRMRDETLAIIVKRGGDVGQVLSEFASLFAFKE